MGRRAFLSIDEMSFSHWKVARIRDQQASEQRVIRRSIFCWFGYNQQVLAGKSIYTAR